MAFLIQHGLVHIVFRPLLTIKKGVTGQAYNVVING
jgi:hypothetical protein